MDKKETRFDGVKGVVIVIITIFTLVMMFLGIAKHSMEKGVDAIDRTQYRYNHR